MSSAESYSECFLGTDSGLKCLKKAFLTCGQLGQWPFIWDEYTERPKVVRSFRGRLSWVLNAILYMAMFAFCLFRFLQLLVQDETPTSTVFYMLIVTVFYAIPVLTYLGCGTSAEEIVATASLAATFCQRYESESCLALNPVSAGLDNKVALNFQRQTVEGKLHCS